MDYLATGGGCCGDRCVGDPDSNEHPPCTLHVCSWSLSAGLLENDELRRTRTYTHRLPCHKWRVSRYSLRLYLWQMTIKLTTLFFRFSTASSDTTPLLQEIRPDRGQTQAFFSPYSTHRLRVRNNNANTAYSVVLLDPRGHMESLGLFFQTIFVERSSLSEQGQTPLPVPPCAFN